MDERDEWTWADESIVGPAPKALPVPGCWRPRAAASEAGDAGDGGFGEPMGDIERIFLGRTLPTEEHIETNDQESREANGETRGVRASELEFLSSGRGSPMCTANGCRRAPCSSLGR